MRPGADAGPKASDDDSREGLKWVTGGIAVAATALALAGLTGAEVVRLTRIHPRAFWFGVAFLVFSTVCGVTGLLVGRQRSWRIVTGMVGLAFFIAGTLVLVWFHADATGIQERPTATLGLAKTANGYSAQVTLKAAELQPDEYVFIVLQGQNSERRLETDSADFSESTQPIPSGEFSKQRLYKGRIGPSPNGTISVSFDIAFAHGLYEQVVVQALIAKPGKSRETDIEFGTVTGRFPCDSVSRDISCATVLVPEAPSHR